jgi:DNA-binding NarL/FixJ family response regulator
MRDWGPEQVDVAFVDDHPMLLLGLSAMIAEYKRFRVTATGICADDARLIAENHRPHLMFMDLSMPGEVLGTIGHIAKHLPHTKVLVFTAFSSVDTALKVMDAGATGFILKGSKTDEIFDAIDTVLRGEMYVASHYANQVFNSFRYPERRERMASAIRLSVRERQIVQQLMHAKTNREIALSLHITEKTVKNYMTGLMNKCHVRNRLEVVIALQKRGELH